MSVLQKLIIFVFLLAADEEEWELERTVRAPDKETADGQDHSNANEETNEEVALSQEQDKDFEDSAGDYRGTCLNKNEWV